MSGYKLSYLQHGNSTLDCPSVGISRINFVQLVQVKYYMVITQCQMISDNVNLRDQGILTKNLPVYLNVSSLYHNLSSHRTRQQNGRQKHNSLNSCPCTFAALCVCMSLTIYPQYIFWLLIVWGVLYQVECLRSIMCLCVWIWAEWMEALKHGRRRCLFSKLPTISTDTQVGYTHDKSAFIKAHRKHTWTCISRTISDKTSHIYGWGVCRPLAGLQIPVT